MNSVEITARQLALQYNAIKLSDLIEWADQQIIKSKDISSGLIDLSLSRNIPEALSALNSLGKSDDKKLVTRHVFHFFYQSLSSTNADYNQIAKSLYDMAQDGWELDNEMYHYWDALDLSKEGVFGDEDTVKSEMLEYLQRNKVNSDDFQ